MTIFKRLLKGSGLGSLFSGLTGLTGDILPGLGNLLKGAGNLWENTGDSAESWFDSKTGRALTGAQREQNQFEHDEAELAYQRQIDYYNQFQSPDAMMRQYREAGLNPALMMTGGNEGSVSPISPPQASGTSAGSQTASLGDIVSLFSNLSLLDAQRQKLVAEAKNTNADTDYKEAQTTGQQIANKFLPTQYETNIENMQANTNLVLSQIDSEVVRRDLMRSDIDLNDAKTALTLQQAYLASLDAETRRELNQLEVKLKDIQTRYEDARIRYTNALTSGAWAEVRKTNQEISNLQAERERIVAETDRIHNDNYGKWLDNSIKEQTLPDVVRKSHFENSDENLRKDWNWQHTSTLVRNVKGAIELMHEGADALGRDMIQLQGGWKSRYESGDYTVGRRRTYRP